MSTALRVIDNHLELENIGELHHEDIDNLLTGSSFLVVTTPSSSLSQARVFAAGPGIIVNDKGPGGLFEITASVTASAGSATITKVEWNEIPSGSINGVNTQFELDFTPTVPECAQVYVNGVLQFQGATCDYTLSGSTILFNTGTEPSTRDNLVVTYEREVIATTKIEWNEVPSGSKDGVNNAFALQYVPSNAQCVQVFLNGVLKFEGSGCDFTLSGSTILFEPGVEPESRDNLIVTYERPC